jgi:glucose uptake protein GlcU
MKFEKGQIIYGVVLLVILILLMFPTSTSFFSMAINDLSLSAWDTWLPDLLGLITIGLGYFALTLFYKKKSKYRKRYPFLAFIIGLIWTITIQVR